MPECNRDISAGQPFHEFYVNTEPDPEDLLNGFPDSELVDEDANSDSDYSGNDDSDEDSDDEDSDGNVITPSLGDSESDRTTSGQPEQKIFYSGKEREAPTQLGAFKALDDLDECLNPSRTTGGGYIDPHFDSFKRTRMEGMFAMLNLFTNRMSKTYDCWSASSLEAAITLRRGKYCARQLRILTKQYIKDRTMLPINPYGSWNESMLVDEDLSLDINVYLLEIGKDISAKKLAEFLAQNDVKAKHCITRTISERTARRYLNRLGYRFTAPKKGQYADGHEREDVVHYREHVFLPQWTAIHERMSNWTAENLQEYGPPIQGRPVVAWFHDESIFYAHDRRKKGWYHKDAPAKPYAKGEGASLMIADFISADFGWLLSKDGKRSARRVMKPRKNKDSYFTNEDIIAQAQEAMDILTQDYPKYDHVLIYDNASTHLKRPEDSLSARRMPKNVPKPGTNWGIEVTRLDPITGKTMYQPDRKPEKIKIRMGDAQFKDGSPQPLYFPEGHERAGVFKGMAQILEERGYGNMSKVHAECKNFKCMPVREAGGTGMPVNCCCRRILYNEPDFINVFTILEATCNARGFRVLFLPKFHCELNPIEQCWGYAKRVYRLNPESSREDHLERNALAALDAVPLSSMRKFANRSRCFMDAYGQGLNGRQAAWASRKYRGHRVLPESLMDDLEKAMIS